MTITKITKKQIDNKVVNSLFNKGGTITEYEALMQLVKEFPNATLSEYAQNKYNSYNLIYSENQTILLGMGILIVDTKQEALEIRKECNLICKAKIEKDYDGKYLVYAIG